MNRKNGKVAAEDIKESQRTGAPSEFIALGRRCNSKPSIFGIRTSSIRQAAATTRPEFSN